MNNKTANNTRPEGIGRSMDDRVLFHVLSHSTIILQLFSYPVTLWGGWRPFLETLELV